MSHLDDFVSVFHVVTAGVGALAAIAGLVAIFHPRGPVQEIKVNTNGTIAALQKEVAELTAELHHQHEPHDE